MTREEVFEQWAPSRSIWSAWAKPVLFAQMPAGGYETSAVAPTDVAAPDWAPAAGSRMALVIDLPGLEAVVAGLALAECGYRPVPLFNSCQGSSAAIDVEPIARRLQSAAAELAKLPLPDDAPPAFLLDWNRLAERVPLKPGMFDNRWLVFPQDFPSAGFLLARAVAGAVLVEPSLGRPRDDLAHVLLRWQEAGLPIYMKNLSVAGAHQPLTVARPSQFRAAWYRALVLMGFRRNSAGGFGSVVPQPSSSGGFS